MVSVRREPHPILENQAKIGCFPHGPATDEDEAADVRVPLKNQPVRRCLIPREPFRYKGGEAPRRLGHPPHHKYTTTADIPHRLAIYLSTFPTFPALSLNSIA